MLLAKGTLTAQDGFISQIRNRFKMQGRVIIATGMHTGGYIRCRNSLFIFAERLYRRTFYVWSICLYRIFFLINRRNILLKTTAVWCFLHIGRKRLRNRFYNNLSVVDCLRIFFKHILHLLQRQRNFVFYFIPKRLQPVFNIQIVGNFCIFLVVCGIKSLQQFCN